MFNNRYFDRNVFRCNGDEFDANFQKRKILERRI